MAALATGNPEGIPIAPFADVKRIAGAEDYDATSKRYALDPVATP